VVAVKHKTTAAVATAIPTKALFLMNLIKTSLFRTFQTTVAIFAIFV
jgi:hypothetical protein